MRQCPRHGDQPCRSYILWMYPCVYRIMSNIIPTTLNISWYTTQIRIIKNQKFLNNRIKNMLSVGIVDIDFWACTFVSCTVKFWRWCGDDVEHNSELEQLYTPSYIYSIWFKRTTEVNYQSVIWIFDLIYIGGGGLFNYIRYDNRTQQNHRHDHR